MRRKACVVRQFEYFIIYMSKDGPLVPQHSESISADGNIVIENTYLIYTPKIIKFVYRQTPQPGQHYELPSSTLSATFQLANSKESKKNKTKLNVVSRGIPQINSDPNKSEDSSKRQSAPEKKTGLQVHTASSKSGSSQVKGQSQAPFLSCGWCANPNQELQSSFPYPSRIQMRTVESRLIEDDGPRKQKNYPEKDPFIIQQEQRIQLDEKITHRKKIFDQANKTLASQHNLSAQGLKYSFSRSRKSIFQHYQIRSRSCSLNTSYQRRNRIFGSPSVQTNLMQEHYSSIKTIQIPPCIIKQWRKQDYPFNFSLPRPETTR